jgi:hypothetical protein
MYHILKTTFLFICVVVPVWGYDAFLFLLLFEKENAAHWLTDNCLHFPSPFPNEYFGHTQAQFSPPPLAFSPEVMTN